MQIQTEKDETIEAVKAEIEAVFKKYDCGGIAIVARLAGPPSWDDEKGPNVPMNGGVAYAFTPSFSELEMDGDYASLKIDPKDYGNSVKDVLMSAAPTVSMLQAMSSMASFCAGTLHQMAVESTEQSVAIFEETKSGGVNKSGMH